ncbi:MAG: zinc-ribbon domain-containing protein [Candidatus Heimdallarchaeaceae archaeon]
MTGIFCPSCGKEHQTNDRYCTYCGADLENVILKFKGERLPVSYNNGKTQRVQVVGTDPESFQGSTKRVPRKRTRNTLGVLTVLLILAIIAVGLVYYFNPDFFNFFSIDTFDTFLYIEIGLGILLILTLFPTMIASNRYSSGGRSTCTSGRRYNRSSDYYFWDCLISCLCYGFLTGLCDRD